MSSGTRQVPLHLESSPAIDGDVVYVGAGAIEDPATHQPISHPGFVVAVRIPDGRELWRYDVADPESSPIVKDGVLYIGSGVNGRPWWPFARAARKNQPEGPSAPLWRTAAPYAITGRNHDGGRYRYTLAVEMGTLSIAIRNRPGWSWRSTA